MSETATRRHVLSKYCVGTGLDLGFGGDPIVPSAITVDRAPGAEHRANVGNHPTNIIGDVSKLHLWFREKSLDYVYSSHTLEDFIDTQAVMRNWATVLKPGGLLVLLLPDEQVYRAHCRATGQPQNGAHIHEDMSLSKILDIGKDLGLEVIYSAFPVEGNPYSFEVVFRK